MNQKHILMIGIVENKTKNKQYLDPLACKQVDHRTMKCYFSANNYEQVQKELSLLESLIFLVTIQMVRVNNGTFL